MTRLKSWQKGAPTGIQPASASVIVIPGVSADALDKQTCCHFQEHMRTWCAAPQIWVYDHGIEPHTRQCWKTFCECGEDLLHEMLVLIEQQPKLELVLIGHRLGAFILKKALILANRRNNQKLPRALFEALRTILMIGDPYLEDENRSEWASLVKDCLHETKNCTPDAFSNIALSGLKTIYETFEDVTIQSQFFQVSGRSPPLSVTRRLLRPKPATKYKNCICDGNVTVRMWSTADDDDIVPSGDGDPLRCVWHGKSNYHQPLRQITCGEYWPKDCGLPVEANELSNNLPPSGSHVFIQSSVAGDSQVDASSMPCDSPLYVQRTTSTDVAPDDQTSSSSTESIKTLAESRDYDSSESHMTSHRHSSSISCRVMEDTSANQEQRSESEPKSNKESDTGRDCLLYAGSDAKALREQVAIETATKTFTESRPRKRPLRLALPIQCEPFIGRGNIMNSLASTVFAGSFGANENAMIKPLPMVVWIQGRPGVGKTQVARQFIERFEDRFDNTFWVHADSQQSISRSIHEIAIALGLVNGRRDQCHENSISLCKTWLAASKTSWLLVLDNVNASDDITPYLTDFKPGSIIVTSQHSKPPPLTCSIVDIPPYTDEESRHYLVSRTPMSWKTSCLPKTQRLLDMIGGHPMALSQIAGIMNKSQSDCVPDLSPLALHMSSFPRDNSDPTILQHVLSLTTKALSSKAQGLLAVLSYLNGHGISESLLLAQDFLGGVDDHLPINNGEFSTLVQELTQARLVQIAANTNSIQIHNERQRALRSLLDSKQNNDAFSIASTICRKQWPSVKKFKNVLKGFWPEFDELHGHAHHLTTQWQPEFDDTDDFMQLITLSSWYNQTIRGNWREDKNLEQLALALHLSASRTLKPTSEAPELSRMPRRLLFVDHERLRVKLVETGRQSRRYCAPSWSWAAWDSIQQINETMSCLLQDGIAMDTMPTWFNNCCSVMKIASLDYIWVDSLCINQTDLAERSRETLRMPEIYRSAEMTIVPRISIEGRRYHKRQLDWGKLRLHCRDDTYQTLSHAKEIMTDDVWEGGFPKRGWVLQEQILSRRALHFSPQDVVYFTPCISENISKGAARVDPPFESKHHDQVVEDTIVADTTVPHPQSQPDLYQEDLAVSSSDGVCEHVETRETLGQSENNTDEEEHDNESNGCLAEAISAAAKAIKDGRRSLQERNSIEAIGNLQHARDLVTSLPPKHSDLLRLHLATSSCLALIYLKENMPQFALNTITTSETLMKEWDAADGPDTLALVEFSLRKGDVHRALGQHQESQTSYRKTADFTDHEDENIADFAIIATLRLSQLFLSNGDITEAHALALTVVSHFEERENTQGLAQYARAKYHQSLIFQAEGKEKMRKRSMAAARQALEEDFGEIPSEQELMLGDFERVMDVEFT